MSRLASMVSDRGLAVVPAIDAPSCKRDIPIGLEREGTREAAIVGDGDRAIRIRGSVNGDVTMPAATTVCRNRNAAAGKIGIDVSGVYGGRCVTAVIEDSAREYSAAVACSNGDIGRIQQPAAGRALGRGGVDLDAATSRNRCPEVSTNPPLPPSAPPRAECWRRRAVYRRPRR